MLRWQTSNVNNATTPKAKDKTKNVTECHNSHYITLPSRKCNPNPNVIRIIVKIYYSFVRLVHVCRLSTELYENRVSVIA